MIRSSVIMITFASASLIAACGQEAPAPAEVAPPPPAAAPEVAPEVVADPAGVPPNITAAVEDAGRPAEHRENDAVRSPAEIVALSGVAPGDIVVDYRAGGGYYTRILSKVVGPEGKVYPTESAERMEGRPDRTEAVDAIAADPA